MHAVAIAGLGITAFIEYGRVSRMTPAQRLERLDATPGVHIELDRLARREPDPMVLYREVLASTRSTFVAEAIGRRLDCAFQDIECALVLVEVLEHLEGKYFTGDVRSDLRAATGEDLPADATSGDWRAMLSDLQEKGQLSN